VSGITRCLFASWRFVACRDAVPLGVLLAAGSNRSGFVWILLGANAVSSAVTTRVSRSDRSVVDWLSLIAIGPLLPRTTVPME
jgi:hypothetical protein